MKPAPVLLVLAGPAGSGKSTLCDRLVNAGLGFTRVITTTTRQPRPGEVNGVHYHFFTPVEFDAKVAAGDRRHAADDVVARAGRLARRSFDRAGQHLHVGRHVATESSARRSLV